MDEEVITEEGFRGSGVLGFKGSEVLGFRGSGVQRFRVRSFERPTGDSERTDRRESANRRAMAGEPTGDRELTDTVASEPTS
jgi:hypothetical protein